MRRAMLASFLTCALLSTAAYGAAVRQPTTQGSFLRYRANSAAELAAMVKKDPLVCRRYAMHFGSTNAGVANFFQNQLRLVRLKKSKATIIYYIGPGGKVARTKRILPAGTLVFTTQQGEPILDWRCGNPLASSLPATRAKTAMKEKAASASATPGGAAAAEAPATTEVASAAPVTDKVIEKVLEQPPAELVAPATLTATLSAPEAPVMVASLPPLVEAAAIPAVTSSGAIPALVSGGSRLGWLLPLAAIGGAMGGGKEQSPLPPNEPVVPEPGAMASLVTGMAITLAGAKRRVLRLRR